MIDDVLTPILNLIWLALMIASCVHVGMDSSRERRIGHPFMHVMMCLVVCWPLTYILWLFCWPGKLRQKLFGSDREKAQRWAANQLRTPIPNQAMHQRPGAGK